MYGPETWRGTEPNSMTPVQIRQELEDISARDLGELSQRAVLLLLDQKRELWQYDAVKLLYAARLSYREYIAEWNPPPNTLKLNLRDNHRPGWIIYARNAEKEARKAEEREKLEKRLTTLRKRHAKAEGVMKDGIEVQIEDISAELRALA